MFCSCSDLATPNQNITIAFCFGYLLATSNWNVTGYVLFLFWLGNISSEHHFDIVFKLCFGQTRSTSYNDCVMATQYQNVTVDCSCILNVFDSWVLYINFDVRLLEAYYIVMKCF